MSDAALDSRDRRSAEHFGSRRYIMYICRLRSRFPPYLVITPLASTTRVGRARRRSPICRTFWISPIYYVYLSVTQPLPALPSYHPISVDHARGPRTETVADLQNIVVLNLAPRKFVCLRVTDTFPANT